MSTAPDVKMADIQSCTRYEDLCSLRLCLNACPGMGIQMDHGDGLKASWEHTINWRVQIFPWFHHFQSKIHGLPSHIIVTHFHADDWHDYDTPRELGANLRNERDKRDDIWPFLVCTYSYSTQLWYDRIEELLTVFDMVHENGQHRLFLPQEIVPWNIAIGMWNTFVERSVVRGAPAGFDDAFLAHLPGKIDPRRWNRNGPVPSEEMMERHKRRVKQLSKLGLKNLKVA